MKSGIRTIALATFTAVALAACPHRASAAVNAYLVIDGRPGLSTSRSDVIVTNSDLATIVTTILAVLPY